MFDKNISEAKRQSLELAEDSRESEWKYPSFALKLFHGKLDSGLLIPFPETGDEARQEGDAFLAKLETILREKLDPDEVDRTGEIPAACMQALADAGAFAIKIPKEYGGLGLGQANYNRAIHLVASYCGSTAVMLSAHQSIGVPQPLKLFGTDEQKKKFLPRFGQGAVSAFALTEPEAGSDPRNMSTTATPVEDGQYFLINGEKLWCTNGPIADVLVVMAVTPPKVIKGRERKQITAFIVETNSPGFEVAHRCRFMGLNGIQNGLLRFKDVKVPAENIILGEGEGLKLALMTLNTGRLTLPAASAGVGKWCLNVARRWGKSRVQWGGPIGEHESVALKIGDIAAHTLAMEAVSVLTAAMADDKERDIRLEAAMAKYFCTEQAWRVADETLQIRGGQGYETAASLKARGMEPWAVERVLRDLRINRIIEGTSEIMHLFIAREALDPHLSRAKPLLMPGTGTKEKLRTLFGLMKYYAVWYPRLWWPFGGDAAERDLPPKLRRHWTYARRASRRLARVMFHQMVRHQKKLESKQSVLNHLVDAGTELFVLCATCAYAQAKHKAQPGHNVIDLADVYCRLARQRIDRSLRMPTDANDKSALAAAKAALNEDYIWLENDIMT